ncbi:hypothetical protein V8D89_008479 [Ganoderma adspersum]
MPNAIKSRLGDSYRAIWISYQGHTYHLVAFEDINIAQKKCFVANTLVVWAASTVRRRRNPLARINFLLDKVLFRILFEGRSLDLTIYFKPWSTGLQKVVSQRALTLPTEVRRVWTHPITGAMLVYLFTRYTDIVYGALFVTEVLPGISAIKEVMRRTPSIALVLLRYLETLVHSPTIRTRGRDWEPLLAVVPLTLIKPVVLIYENTWYTPREGRVPFGCFYNYTLPTKTIADSVTARSGALSPDPLIPLFARLSTIAKAGTIASGAILIGFTWVTAFSVRRESSRLGMHTSFTTLLLPDETAYFMYDIKYHPLLLQGLVTIESNQVGSKITVRLVDRSRFMLDLRDLDFSECYPPAVPGAELTFFAVGNASDIRFAHRESSGTSAQRSRTPALIPSTPESPRWRQGLAKSLSAV